MHSLKELDQTEGTVQLRSSTNTLPSAPLCTFTFLANYGIGGLSPAFYGLSIEFHKTQSETSALLLWPILVLGLFNFFWVPVANYFGKRPVFVFASLLLCVCYIWGACAQSFESLLWSNIVAAFAGSSTEALGAAIVSDLYFLHERGAKMGIYMNAISGGNTVGPLICGFVVQSIGWRWHKWISVIFTAVNFFVVAFFCPETRYDRDSAQNLTTSSVMSLSSDEEQGVVEKTASQGAKEVPSSLASQAITVPKKTWRQEISLWSGTPTDTSLVKLFIRPFPLLVYPAVIFAFLGYAVALAWVVAINILNSFVLQAPPYNWGPSINGLINIPGLLGNIFGAFAGGWLVDGYSDWRAKRNGGVFQPETRLTLLIIPTLLVPAGCLVFGYGVQQTLNWTSLFFGYGMVAVGLTAVPTITMTYVSDCYLPVAPDALLLVNGLKNIVAFGFLYGVVPWITKSGYVNTFGTQAGVFVAIMALAIPLAIFGERIRHKTGQWRIIL
ncbi:major facilitator superfamily domain-containing protein [Cryomyces antarcticus]